MKKRVTPLGVIDTQKKRSLLLLGKSSPRNCCPIEWSSQSLCPVPYSSNITNVSIRLFHWFLLLHPLNISVEVNGYHYLIEGNRVLEKQEKAHNLESHLSASCVIFDSIIYKEKEGKNWVINFVFILSETIKTFLFSLFYLLRLLQWLAFVYLPTQIYVCVSQSIDPRRIMWWSKRRRKR